MGVVRAENSGYSKNDGKNTTKKYMVKHHNHFKIGINNLELLHYRSGKSKSIFVDIQNPCLHPP